MRRRLWLCSAGLACSRRLAFKRIWLVAIWRGNMAKLPLPWLQVLRRPVRGDNELVPLCVAKAVWRCRPAAAAAAAGYAGCARWQLAATAGFHAASAPRFLESRGSCSRWRLAP